jgi:ABC-type polysaccharide/polyol phosphate transport system ATPase subunit
MTDTVITVEHISKSYLVGHMSAQRGRHTYTALRDVIARGVQTFGRKALDVLRGRQVIQGDEIEEFWALKDVSFEVKRGEVLGIIGRNGAGKSTLLKILSRITEPTKGRVLLRGRVASLLEVGTGFHAELSGRENIFLNGAILGMTQREIRKKFDEIVAFAEVEKFLDTPVKRYSSGMYVRLAFAVAAHLEPEILVVDEVLAVGDAEFQRKCIGKMQDVAGREGRTVLLVSHNLAVIGELTARALLLNTGEVEYVGSATSAISRYLSHGAAAPVYIADGSRVGRRPYVRRAEIVTSDADARHRFGEPLEIRFHIGAAASLTRGCLSVQIVNQFQQPVVHAFAYYPDLRLSDCADEDIVICRFDSPRLNVGEYRLRWFLSEPPGGEQYEMVDGVCRFEVTRTDKSIFWGWRPEACTYHEHWAWTIERARVLEGA